jgi:hypothetical protein
MYFVSAISDVLVFRFSGLGDAPRTLLEEAKIKSGDAAVPARSKDGRYQGTVLCMASPNRTKPRRCCYTV